MHLASVQDSLHPITLEMGVIKMAGLALAEYPDLNSTPKIEQMTLTYQGMHNIRVAVDMQLAQMLDIAQEPVRLSALVMEGNLMARIN